MCDTNPDLVGDRDFPVVIDNVPITTEEGVRGVLKNAAEGHVAGLMPLKATVRLKHIIQSCLASLRVHLLSFLTPPQLY